MVRVPDESDTIGTDAEKQIEKNIVKKLMIVPQLRS